MIVTLMSFSEALREGLIRKGDYLNLPKYLWKDDNKEVSAGRNMTGCGKDQVFKREDNLRWVYAMDFQGKPAIFASPTEFDLILSRRTGYENAEEVLSSIVSAYSNEDLGLYARSLKEEDAKFLGMTFMLENILSYNEKKIWLANKRPTFQFGKKIHGIRTYESLGINTSYLVNYCGVRDDFAGICPVLSVEGDKLYIDLESMKNDGVWKVVPIL